MPRNKIRREHNLSIPDLYMISLNTVSLVERDIDMFSKYGFTVLNKDDFKEKVERFGNIKGDLVYEAVQMMLTDAKNKLLEELKTLIREFLLVGELIYNKTEIDYYSFDKRKIAQQSDADIYVTTIELIQISEKNFEKISEYGITQNQIDNLKNKSANYIDTLVKRNISISERETATIARTKASNELYKELSTIRNLGRKMWAEVSYAHSNDYFLT